MKSSVQLIFLFGIIAGFFLPACRPQDRRTVDDHQNVEAVADADSEIAVSFTLKTIANEGKLAYLGIGGDIDGVVNPDLTVQPGSVVMIILVNGDGMPHDLFLPDFDEKTSYVTKIGDQTEIVFEVRDVLPGNYAYYCTVPGHRQAGQEGKMIITNSQE